MERESAKTDDIVILMKERCHVELYAVNGTQFTQGGASKYTIREHRR